MLTRRKQDFIRNYIDTRNATKSAELSGYSLKTAYSQGSRLLKQVEVKEAVERGIVELMKAREITKERIMDNLWNEACKAQRSADRIQANVALAKIRGDIKDSTSTQVAVFTGDMVKDLPPIEVEPSQEGAKPDNDVSH